MQGRLWPHDQRDLLLAATEGLDVNRVMTLDDLCGGDDVFVAATGVTDGELLKGVRYTGVGASTDSLVMRSRSGTIRRVEATHDFGRLRRRAGARYEGLM
jgi:fructose-1,6-bisphosphatase II